jgi:hypothetical protein
MVVIEMRRNQQALSPALRVDTLFESFQAIQNSNWGFTKTRKAMIEETNQIQNS